MTFNQTNRKGLTREQLHDLDLAEDTQRPAGRYVVELADADTGKAQRRVSENNYITPLYDRVVRWWQGGLFTQTLRHIHQSAATQYFPPHLQYGLDRPPMIPIECMVGTDSVLPEDENSSWATGLVLGWGVRWKGTVAATGPRGQINEAQSEVALNNVKLVWDFNENQGNGDYGSLAIARIQHPTQYNTGIGPAGDTNRTFPVIGLPGQWPKMPITDPYSGVSSRLLQARIVGMDDTYIYLISQRTSATTTLRLFRYPLAGYTGGPTVLTAPAAEALTSADLASLTLFSNTTEGTGAVSYQTGIHMAMYGANILMAWADYTGSLRMGQWTTAGARVGTDLVVSSTDPAAPENAASGSFNCGLAVIGTKAYVTGRGHSNIYRVELTTMTVDATIPIPQSAVAQVGLCTDGTDLFVLTYKGIFKITTAGAYVECYGHPFSKGWYETGQAPWAATAQAQRMGFPWEREMRWYTFEATNFDRSSGLLQPYENPMLSPQYSISEYSDATAFANLFYCSNGVLYGARRMQDESMMSGTVPIGGVYPIGGQSCISRRVLDSPVTKTSSSTMKWTYSLTLPSSWSEIPALVSPPS